jgi:hypothetical protein
MIGNKHVYSIEVVNKNTEVVNELQQMFCLAKMVKVH